MDLKDLLLLLLIGRAEDGQMYINIFYQQTGVVSVRDV